MAYDGTKIVDGGDLMLFLNGHSIAFATSHSLSISAETSETTNKDIRGGWASSKVKKLSWTCNTENLYANTGSGTTFADLFNLMIAKTEITAIFGLKSQDASTDVPNTGWTPATNIVGEGSNTVVTDDFPTYYTGKVVITSLEVNAPDDDNATFTCEFTGCGALTKVSPTGQVEPAEPEQAEPAG